MKTSQELIEKRNRYLSEYKTYLYQARESGDMHAAELAFASAKMAQQIDIELAQHNQRKGIK